MRTAWDACVTLWVATAVVAGFAPGHWTVPSLAGALMLLALIPFSIGLLAAVLWRELKTPLASHR